ncbi:unnamed protein product, partial [Angiostrongylus costaricensis]|uniref:Rap-GAP domain-containing protein n=1 Tax=Angiostrongylus costaricensis TaxID=334426 RepID=A0A0R3PNR5_ANGCS
VIFPVDDHNSQLRVVQGPVKNRPAEPLHHVVFTLSDLPNAPSYSLFRSTVVEDAVDLCRRCVECKILFRILGSFNNFFSMTRALDSWIGLFRSFQRHEKTD